MARDVRFRLTFLVLIVALSTYALLQSFVFPVITSIERDLHTNATAGSWILTAYLLTASVFTPIVGRIGDIFGRERVFVAALVILALGSVLAALASNITVMITARAIQGVGGGVLPLAFGIVRDVFPADRVAPRIGALASIIGVFTGLGAVLAGPIVDLLSYHWLFWFPAILVGLAALASIVILPMSSQRSPGKISWSPAVLMSGWLVCLLVGLSQASRWGWGSMRVLGLFGAAAVLCATWVVVEQRVASPLVDMRMMRLPAVWTCNLSTILMGVAMYASFGFLPSFAQTPTSAGYGYGASITVSGLILLPAAATSLIFGVLSAPLVKRFGAKAVVVAGMLISFAGFAVFTQWHDSIWQACVLATIYGIGFGMAFSATAVLIVDAVPRDQTGVASGMNANIRTVGGSIGSALAASFITSGVGSGALPHESGYRNVFLLMAVACLLAAVASLLIPSGAPPASDSELEEAHPSLGLLAAGTVIGTGPE
ncbi:MAG: major facilitator superfamily 1 [Pseudonocardiales bacterium]|nr:major facilitator superfamily 1 [Pseudonocardiales bacterium]